METGFDECVHDICNAIFTNWTDARVAGGKRYQAGIEREFSDFAHLEKAVVDRRSLRCEDERRAVRVFRIRVFMQREVNDVVLTEWKTLEGRLGRLLALRRIRSADGAPGAAGQWLGDEFRFYDAHPEDNLRGEPGQIIAQRNGAVCVGAIDGAIWIGHLHCTNADDHPPLKLPAVAVLGKERLLDVPESPPEPGRTCRDLWYEENNGVGYLHFPFYNGAMSTGQCARLRRAVKEARSRPTQFLVLMGGSDFWSNGIHLGVIENAVSPAEESWRNIQAMDDLVLAILECSGQITIAAMQGNAGAGGVFLALAADYVWARTSVILNPHYRGMGNLYGSEYWTYLLPRRTGSDTATEIAHARLPVGTAEALRWGLIDDRFGETPQSFTELVRERAEELAADPSLPHLLAEKRCQRIEDEAQKSLAQYRAEELEHMKLNFFGFDPSYHIARYNFIRRVPKARTPSYLATHRNRSICTQERPP